MCKLSQIQTNFNTTVMVAELKKNSVQNIIHAASLCPRIQSVYLFGSSLEERCAPESDIDLALMIDTSPSKLYQSRSYRLFRNEIYEKNADQGFDFLHIRSDTDLSVMREPIHREIFEKGKEIYRRNCHV